MEICHLKRREGARGGGGGVGGEGELGVGYSQPTFTRILNTDSDCVKNLTLKAPNKYCSRRHFNFLPLSFEKNKALFFM